MLLRFAVGFFGRWNGLTQGPDAKEGASGNHGHAEQLPHGKCKKDNTQMGVGLPEVFHNESNEAIP